MFITMRVYVALQDEEDEFEHLQDDEEFEGFDSTNPSKPNKGQEKQPDLKVAKVKSDLCAAGLSLKGYLFNRRN